MFDNIERKPISVSEFNQVIKEVVKGLGVFKVQGEITEFKISPNKGVYITLSDGTSNLPVAGYAPAIRGLDQIEKGMKVVIEGSADIYVPYGKFSLKAISIEPEGEGALGIAYEKLKKKLDKEGLFAQEHKQVLPPFITKVALLTGKDSAAYSDFIKILRENKVNASVSYFPVLVQGKKSVEAITSSLKSAKKMDVDIIILTRGGGSLEDLKSFNDEELARLIFSSPIPVIVGVGHENDESICDFVADLRASTPSQAAYYIAQRNADYLEVVEGMGDLVNQLVGDQVTEKKNQLKLHENIIDTYIDHTIGRYKDTLITHTSLIEGGIRKLMQSANDKINVLERIIASFNVGNVLKRGFAILQKEGKQVKSIVEIELGDKLTTLMADGKFNSKVTNKDGNKRQKRLKGENYQFEI